MRQRKQAQIEKYVIRENTTRIHYNYRVGDQSTTIKKSAYKYKTLFKGPYEKFQTLTNRTVTLRTGAVTTRINICRIKPYNNSNIELRGPI